jgi:pantetheine-phosphate adenylyltransferase
MVDHLVIGVAINEAKAPLFTLDERVEMVRHETASVAKDAGVEITVRPFDSLLMHFAEEVGAQMIIRGLRAVSDFEYEFQMVSMNMQLNRDIETVFLMAGAEHGRLPPARRRSPRGGDISHFRAAATSPRGSKRRRTGSFPPQGPKPKPNRRGARFRVRFSLPEA